MTELYWISILDPLCNLSTIVFIISLFTTLICGIFTLVNVDESCYSVLFKHTVKEYRNVSLVVLLISSVLVIFVPTSKDAYMIYGVGGTIDYLQSNDTAKKLPDKCIIALDKFVSEYTDSIK